MHYDLLEYTLSPWHMDRKPLLNSEFTIWLITHTRQLKITKLCYMTRHFDVVRFIVFSLKLLFWFWYSFFMMKIIYWRSNSLDLIQVSSTTRMPFSRSYYFFFSTHWRLNIRLRTCFASTLPGTAEPVPKLLGIFEDLTTMLHLVIWGNSNFYSCSDLSQK